MAPRSARVALVILTELSSLFYSGTVFGWAPMLLVLQREGLFSELCDESSPSPSEGGGWCDAQKEQLGLIFTWAAVVYSASGIVVGAFLDAAGPAWGVVAACATSVVGSYLFACSWAWASGWVVILGYSLIGVGGMCFFQCAFKAQYAFPRPNGGGFEKQTLIIAIATTFGDASVCMWLLFEWLYSNVGLSLDAIFKGYILFTVVLSAILGALWRLCGPDILALEPRDSDGDGEGDAPKSSSLSSSSGDSSYGAVPTSEPGAPSSASSFAAYKGGSIVLLKDRPFHDQLWTLEFLQMMVFQAVHTTRANLYLGLLAYFYESAQFIGATGDRTKFVNITSALVPLGCFCAPVVERLIDNLGFGWTAQVIALGGAAQSFIMLSSSLQLQYAAAAVFLVYRANVFAFPPTFAGQIFGPRTCGKSFHFFPSSFIICYIWWFVWSVGRSVGRSVLQRMRAWATRERAAASEIGDVLMMFQTSNHSDFFVRKKRIALHFY
jgi:LAT3 family solute carrier family 43 protein 3